MSRSTKIAIGGAAALAVVCAFVVLARTNDRAPVPPKDAGTAVITRRASIETTNERPAPMATGAVSTTAPPVTARRRMEFAPVREEDPRDEADLLATLHELAGSDPPESLRLARRALDRFPNGSHAPEFEWNVVKALFNMGQLDDAKAEARLMLQQYPDSDFTSDVDRHLLNTPPNPP